MKYIAILDSDDKLSEDAINELKETAFVGDEKTPYCFEITSIKEEPTADVKPIVHAHWDVIDQGSEGDECFLHVWATLRCSNCGIEREVEDDYIPEYCEGCGAKMEGEE